jgi:hypothetical protein
MPVDPNSIAPGKCYITATRHIRTVLEVTDERVRYAHGGGEAGNLSQWRWQTKAKFANDAVMEVSSEETAPLTLPRTKIEKQENAETSDSKDDSRSSGSRKILSKRR